MRHKESPTCFGKAETVRRPDIVAKENATPNRASRFDSLLGNSALVNSARAEGYWRPNRAECESCPRHKRGAERLVRLSAPVGEAQLHALGPASPVRPTFLPLRLLLLPGLIDSKQISP